MSTAQQAALNAKANASDTVNLTGNQTVAGVKTFSSSPVVPTATTNTQAVNKAQMDTADALKVSKAGDTMTGRLGNSTSNLASSNTRGGKEILYGATSIGNFGALNNTDGIEFFNALSNGTGITLGASNSTAILKGTGFPNGVVSAPVGSTYIDTAATNGAIEWKKETGSSTTGWVVSVGDTGWRDITAEAAVTIPSGSSLIVRRSGAEVTFALMTTPGAAAWTIGAFNLWNFQSGQGFRPKSLGSRAYVRSNGILNRSWRHTTDTAGVGLIYALWDSGDAAYRHLRMTTSSATSLEGSTSYQTSDDWPATLPGTAV